MIRIKCCFLVSIILVACLGVGGYLAFENSALRIDLDISRDAEAARRVERDNLMRLLPEIGQNISKEQLASIIRKQYPNEEINIVESHVQWRLLHFWFDRDGKLESVQWGS